MFNSYVSLPDGKFLAGELVDNPMPKDDSGWETLPIPIDQTHL